MCSFLSSRITVDGVPKRSARKDDEMSKRVQSFSTLGTLAASVSSSLTGARDGWLTERPIPEEIPERPVPLLDGAAVELPEELLPSAAT